MGDPDADTKQMKAFLAAEIIAALNRRHLTVRAAAEVTGVSRRIFRTSATPILPSLPSIGLCGC
ncbi:hypothetical protein [Mesorhizobium sp. M0701]|uniref:hypothetical protein n=1 Tax=Mesorhizobium sp. M0701 TaxID=2956989 RepID=UPI0033386F1E